MPWPERLLHGTQRSFSLQLLHHNREQAIKDSVGAMSLAYPGQTWLCGYALPPFQRPLVWDEARMVRFVESAVLGLHLGTFVYNEVASNEKTVMVAGREAFPRVDRWLIDGQQRLTALDRFFGDEFKVFGEKWSEIRLPDQRRFLSTSFGAFETSMMDEAQLRELYDRLNFGGIAHTQDQRAVKDGGKALPSEVEVDDDAPPSPGMR